MTTLQETPRSIRRITHMAGIRATLKDIPLLKLNIALLKNSLKTKTSIHTDISANSNEEMDSPSSGHDQEKSTLTDFKTYNSFLEKYDILEKLGEGGNGCVFKCQHKANKKFYAVKKFRVQEQHILELKKNFLSIQKLKHSSICQYKALYFDQGKRIAYLVTQYLTYPNLAECHITSEKELINIVKQILAGLQYLHKHNICHRDIKPQNILYDRESGKIKIIDFGIAKKTFSRGVRREMLTIIGTNFYFAPEIFIGGGYDERVDIWALGILIYKLIAGYTPFESEFHSDTINNILNSNLTFDQKLWAKFNPFAKDFIGRLLKQKSKRMTINQCLNHLWLQDQDTRNPIRLRKLSSFSLELSQQFRLEMKNSQEAISKEQGSYKQKEDQNISKKIKLIHGNQFDLEDSEDQSLFLECQQLQLKTRRLTL